MQILSTKLAIPPLRSRLVARPRLFQKLSQGLDCGFILVSAPAGYGKSTLLSAWLKRLDLPAAWLSLDDRDNDLSTFLAYLVATLQSIDPAVGPGYEAIPTSVCQADVDALLTSLINRLAGRKQPCCLVLDDYHVIQNPAVHQAVTFLLEHRPAPLQLVITTRADPPLPLARLRARSCVLELRMADLRFTIQEAADFLGYTMGLKISEEDVARLTSRTEGWIAGLQIAALSMQAADDIPGFIQAFAGSHHYIFDYLLNEILDKQPPEIKRFLLATSILDELYAPLCDALIARPEGAPSGQESAHLLEQLDHANLFIIPLDLEQHWYRYHPLFSELLRSYLKKISPEEIPLLHARASEWFEAQGMISQAIRHSLASQDWERIIRLISTNIFALLEQRELNNVARQIESLTGESSPARPWLLIGRAWLAAYTGQLAAVAPLLKMAEAEIDNLKNEAELQTLGGHIAAIRAYVFWIDYDWETAEKAARAALEWLPETEYLIRCQAATILGLTISDLDSGAQAFEQAISYANNTSHSHVTIFAYASYAWLLAMQGNLRQAESMCMETIRLAQSSAALQSLPTLSHVYTTLSFILCEWNKVDRALQYSEMAVDLARRWEQVDALHFALSYQAYALLASGATREAYEVLRQAWQIACKTSAWFRDITISQEIDMHLIQADLAAAQECARQAGLDRVDPSEISFYTFKTGYMAMVSVRLFVAQKHYKQAVEVATRILPEMEKRKIWNYVNRTRTWQALAYHGLRQDDQALACLKRVLTMAVPEGFVRTFYSLGGEFIPVLQLARKDGLYPEYMDTILRVNEQDGQHPVVQSGLASTLVEPLSEREMDVLNLLAQGCSDQKIAAALVIARETVHKHLKNIYGKLDVHSRTEAVARARQLKLI